MGPLCISEENLALIGVPLGRRENKQKNVFLINVVKNWYYNLWNKQINKTIWI